MWRGGKDWENGMVCGERQSWRLDGGDRWGRGLRLTCCHCPVGAAGCCAAEVYEAADSAPQPDTQPRDPPGSVWAATKAKMRKGSLSGLDLLKGPPRFLMPLEAMLVSVVHSGTPSHDEAWDPCGFMQSVPLPDALVTTSLCFAAWRAGLGEAILMWMTCANLWTCGHVEAPGPAATEGHERLRGPDMAKCCVNICGPCYHWSPCGCLLLEA